MDDLFRCVTLRPPQSSEGVRTLSLAQDTRFQENLAAIRNNSDGDVRDALVSAARQAQTGNIEGEDWFVRDPATQLTLYDELLQLRRELLSSQSVTSLDRLIATIRAVFGIGVPPAPEAPRPRRPRSAADPAVPASHAAPLAAFVADEEFRQTTLRIFDSIIALFLDPVRYPHLLPVLVELAQTIDVVVRASRRDAALETLPAIRAALSIAQMLPERIFPVRAGKPQPVGVADLLVVKQQLIRYELGEVQDIENILQGETRRASTRQIVTREETRISDRERTEETEEEQEVSERFELMQQVEQTLEEDLQLNAGVTVNARYGTVLDISAKTDVSYRNSRRDAVQQATTRARDVTTRAATRVTERVRDQVTTRSLESTETEDERTLNNSQGSGNITGVYQWMNKIYQAQVFNYGKRLLFDLTVPEPAAFLLDAFAGEQQTSLPREPPRFDLTVAQIEWELPLNEANRSRHYETLVVLYQAVGVTEPPSREPRSISTTITGQGNGDDLEVSAEDNLQAPDGYVATQATIAGLYQRRGNSYLLVVYVADQAVASDDQTLEGTLSLFTPGTRPGLSNVAIGVSGHHVTNFAATVTVRCEATAAATEAWRFRTYNAILAAYQEQLRTYQDQLAASTAQRRFATTLSGNPEQNRRTERTELKKACLSLFLGDGLLGFQAVDEGLPGEPPPEPGTNRRFPRPAADGELVQRQARIVRFFEQAFEWEQMSYVFYPYFWGRSRQTWYEKVLLEHNDALFAEFLKAGEARVVVPVRPGFEADLRYYLILGDVWAGGELPDITDPNYLPITDEIRERTGAPGVEVPQDAPWEVRVPTRLIRLRRDSRVPRWQQDPSAGPWTFQPIPAEDF